MFGRFFERYLLPGFVFQSIIIAGGYGIGRELVEFFLQYGPLAGLLGMIVFATPTVSLTAAASFEFARIHRTFDYFSLHLCDSNFCLGRFALRSTSRRP